MAMDDNRKDLDLGVVAVTHFEGRNDKSRPKNGKSDAVLDKKARIRQELINAGMTSFGLKKFNTRYLPKLLANNEHVHGVIYGLHTEGPGFLNWVDRMIVATNHRIISLNRKPGILDKDEFTYDIVSDLDISYAGPFAAVTLSIRNRSFSVRFVNKRCAEIFATYIRKRRLQYFAFFRPGEAFEELEETDKI